MKLIKFFETNPVLRDKNSGKVEKTAKKEAKCRLVGAFDEQYIISKPFAVWRSLRASMRREVKREKENKTLSSWKFYCSFFSYLKPVMLRAWSKSDECSDLGLLFIQTLVQISLWRFFGFSSSKLHHQLQFNELLPAKCYRYYVYSFWSCKAKLRRSLGGRCRVISIQKSRSVKHCCCATFCTKDCRLPCHDFCATLLR